MQRNKKHIGVGTWNSYLVLSHRLRTWNRDCFWKCTWEQHNQLHRDLSCRRSHLCMRSTLFYLVLSDHRASSFRFVSLPHRNLASSFSTAKLYSNMRSIIWMCSCQWQIINTYNAQHFQHAMRITLNEEQKLSIRRQIRFVCISGEQQNVPSMVFLLGIAANQFHQPKLWTKTIKLE